jgi:hypothetical protein
MSVKFHVSAALSLEESPRTHQTGLVVGHLARSLVIILTELLRTVPAFTTRFVY